MIINELISKSVLLVWNEDKSSERLCKDLLYDIECWAIASLTKKDQNVFYRRTLWISWTENVTNEQVSRIGTTRRLLIIIRKRNLIHNKERKLGKLNTHRSYERWGKQKKAVWNKFEQNGWRNMKQKKSKKIYNWKGFFRTRKNRKLWTTMISHYSEETIAAGKRERKPAWKV